MSNVDTTNKTAVTIVRPITTNGTEIAVIQRGIPIPERNFPATRNRGSRMLAEFPLHLLQVGDSFASEACGSSDKQRARLLSLMTRYREKTGAVFAYRTLEENGRRVVRVWRTA